MIGSVENQLLEILQTGGVGALITLIMARYLLDLIFAKKGKKERDQYRDKLDQVQSSINEIKGNVDTLVKITAAKVK